MSNSLYYQPKQEVQTCFLPQFQPLNPQLSDNHLNHGNHFSSKISLQQYNTLESSSTATGSCNVYENPASQLYSLPYPYEKQHYSPDTATYGSPMSGSCVTEDVNDLKHKLWELETAMMGPDADLIDSYDSSAFQGNGAQIQLAETDSWGQVMDMVTRKDYDSSAFQGNGALLSLTETDSWGRVMDMITRKDLKRVLISCAKAVSDDDSMMTQWLMDELRQMVSVSGEPIQRLGAYMLEGLVARQASSGSSIYKALRSKVPASADLLSYMNILYEVCPYIKFGYMSANGAIAEAMKDEHRVHIIDFQIGQGSQWVTLIQAFAARPGGPPRIRITGIDDVYSAYARGGGLGIVGKRLSRLAKSFNVPFEFHAAAMSGSEVELGNLRVEPGDSLAVNFAFTLHHMPDESVSTENHRDRLLRLVKSLSPKVVTLVEQECNTNSAAFFPRFMETLDYYTAMFESMDVTLPRVHKDRINVEQHCLARDVVNLIACEGAERVERQELLGKWRSRFLMAGFKPCPLSSLVNTTIKMLLRNYSEKYRLEEKDGALYLGWRDRNLVASCAWQ